MIDAPAARLNPECRWCHRPFGSWWPRDQHEIACPAKEQTLRELRRELEKVRVPPSKSPRRRIRKAPRPAPKPRRPRPSDEERRARKLRYMKEYNARRVPSSPVVKPVEVFTCPACEQDRAVAYEGDGNGTITAVFCLDCRTVSATPPV